MVEQSEFGRDERKIETGYLGENCETEAEQTWMAEWKTRGGIKFYLFNRSLIYAF